MKLKDYRTFIVAVIGVLSSGILLIDNIWSDESPQSPGLNRKLLPLPKLEPDLDLFL